MSEWIKNKSQLYVTYKKLNLNMKTQQTKSNGKNIHTGIQLNKKKAEVTILISAKVEVRT